jgi:hypothetical protein
MTPEKLKIAREMYASRKHTTAAIAAVVGVSRATLYRALTPSPITDHALQPSTIEAPVAPSATADDREARAPTRPGHRAAAGRFGTAARSPARAVELPSDAAALARECPSCGARAAVMCRNTHSREEQAGRRADAPRPLLARSPLPRLPCAPRRAVPHPDRHPNQPPRRPS